MIDVEFLSMPFWEALGYFRKKGYAISTSGWREVWKQANARAFTVASVTRMDVLVDIRKALDAAIDEGMTLREFKDGLKDTLTQKGWLAPKGEKAKVVLPDGTVEKRLTGWRLDNIYETNLGAAYQVGRYEQMQTVKARRPYWQYMTAGDVSVRETHAAQAGKIYHADHPFWDYWYPPNGFRCRCYVRTLSARQMEKQGLKEEKRGVAERPDEGWDYNVGKAGLDDWQPDMGKYPPELRGQA